MTPNKFAIIGTMKGETHINFIELIGNHSLKPVRPALYHFALVCQPLPSLSICMSSDNESECTFSANPRGWFPQSSAPT